MVIERNSPKLPKERTSMSFFSLNNATNVFKIIFGESKLPIVKRFLEGEELLANVVNGEVEKIFIHNNLISKKE